MGVPAVVCRLLLPFLSLYISTSDLGYRKRGHVGERKPEGVRIRKAVLLAFEGLVYIITLLIAFLHQLPRHGYSFFSLPVYIVIVTKRMLYLIVLWCWCGNVVG